MRTTLALLVLFALAGCETSPLGGRCTNNYDCDRNPSTATSQCVRASNPGSSCGGSDYCICCPISRATDAGVPSTCWAGNPVDSGVVDVVTPDATDVPRDVVSDAVSEVSADVVSTDTGACSCPIGQWCNDLVDASTDTGPMCQPLRAIGVACVEDSQCQTSHCTDSVCCNSACTGAGLSCNSSPDFSGLCMPIASTDAGTDASVTDVTPADAATE